MTDQAVRLQSNGPYWIASWYDSRGKRVRKSIGAKSRLSKLVATRLCKDMEIAHALKPARRDLGRTPSLAAWLDRYMELRDDLADSTRTMHRETKRYLLEFFAGGRRLWKITRADAAEWRAWLPIAHKMGEQSVCRHVRTAKVMFKWAVDLDLIADNPFDRVKGTPPRVDKDWRHVTDDEIRRLVDACPTPAWKALVGLCGWAGLRVGEARRMTWTDVQWHRNRLLVFHEGRQTTKRRRREVLLELELATLLLDCQDVSTSPLVAPVSANNLHRYMIGDDRLGYTGIIRTAGLEPWSKPFHTLRKARTASWLASGQHDISAVSDWIGDGIDVLMRHYRGIINNEYRSAREKLADDKELIRSLEAEVARLKGASRVQD